MDKYNNKIFRQNEINIAGPSFNQPTSHPLIDRMDSTLFLRIMEWFYWAIATSDSY